MSINEVQDEVIAEFNDFDDWMDRYQLLIDLGNEQEPLDDKYKTEQNLIEGCQSRVWLQADEENGRIVFQAESDALIVKRHYLAAYQSAVRTYPGRDSECGPLLYRQDRIKGASFSPHAVTDCSRW